MPNVLITGGTSGIGLEAARTLARAGFEVFASSRRKPEAPLGEGIQWVEMDVCNEDSVDKAVSEVEAASAPLEAVVCNAGFGIFGSIEEVSMDAAQRQFDTNIGGVLRVVRRVLPGMRERRRGRVVLVGSLGGRAPIPFQAHYSASKAAVEALAGSLYNEVLPYDIQVSLIEPGDINTPFNAAMDWSEGESSAYAERIARSEQVIRESLPKAPGPEVVAQAIEKALTAAKPRFRYSVGPDSFLVPLGKRLFPDALVLRLIRSHFRI